jgi:hypothetical protein
MLEKRPQRHRPGLGAARRAAECRGDVPYEARSARAPSLVFRKTAAAQDEFFMALKAERSPRRAMVPLSNG